MANLCRLPYVDCNKVISQVIYVYVVSIMAAILKKKQQFRR